jgi:hypothetical protein
MKHPEPGDKDNTLPRYLCITSMQITACQAPERKERTMNLIVEYVSGLRKRFTTMSSISEALGVEYDVVKIQLYKRKHGIDSVSTDQHGEKFRIYNEA